MKSKLFLVCMLLSLNGMVQAESLSTWTMASNSVQGVLYGSLRTLFEKDLRADLPYNRVKQSGATLTAGNKSTFLSCTSTQLGMAAVQSYSCVLKGDISPWSTSWESVQGVVYEALKESYEQDQASPYPFNDITRDGTTFSVQDENTSLSCKLYYNQRGIAPMPNFSCELK